MRIIAGQFRGVALESPPGRTTRPITDRVKETLFNILGSRYGAPGIIPEVAVLDIFAGPGSLGLEALSRGATSCSFVERDRAALKALRNNLKKLRVEDRTAVVTDNAWTMRFAGGPAAYGLVFIDPPYRDVDNPVRSLDLFERLAPALTPDALVLFRYDARIQFPDERIRSLEVLDRRTFGKMRLLLLSPPARRSDEAPEPDWIDEIPPPDESDLPDQSNSSG